MHTNSNLQCIKNYWRALMVAFREMGAQAVSSSVLLVMGKEKDCINNGLQSWCQQQDFGFYDHGSISTWKRLDTSH